MMAPDSGNDDPLQRWLDELARLDESGRRARIAALAEDDPALAGELAALLSQETAGGEHFERAVAHLVHSSAAELPTQIGGFRLLRVLGRGGMGVVYLAERDKGEVLQRVALKVLGQQVLSPQTLTRFYAERRILAALNHPNIATLIESGAADDGTPWLAMEFIDGVPIDQFVARAGLDRAACVRLTLGVLAAVGFAHRNLVVHRDLKPGNILVTADGVPKLVDFGIARLLDDGRADTRTRMYTPEYASPEQLQGGSVTTATDLYAFGVVLHELLTGHVPARSSGGARSADTGLPSDLRRMFERLLAVDPAQRYASAAGVAGDLEAHLSGSPLVHARESPRERLRKRLRRHRLALAVAATAAISVLALALTMSWSAARLKVERDRALVAQRSAQQVAEYLVGVFEQADPNVAAGRTTTARDLLDAGVKRIDTLEGADAATQAQLYEALGRIYRNLGLNAAALGLFERADAAQAHAPELPPEARLRLLRRIAGLLQDSGDMARADAALKRAEALLARESDLPPSERVLLLAARANHFQQLGDVKAAERGFAATIAAWEAVGESRSNGYAQALQNLGGNLLEQNQPAQALPLFRRALEIRRALYGEEHMDTAFSRGNVGRTLRSLGDIEGALRELEAVLATRERLLGPDHPDVGQSANEIANLYHDLGRVPEAEANYRRAIAIARQGDGSGSSALAFALNNLAILLEQAGRFEEAEPLYRESIEIRRRHAGDDGLRVVKAEQNYAVLLSRLGRLEAAQALLEHALALRQRELGTGHVDTRISQANLDQVRWMRERSETAAQRSRQSWQALNAALADQPALRGQFELRLAQLELATGRLDEAESGFRAALESFAGQDRDSVNVAVGELGLGLVLRARGDAKGDALIERARGIALPTLAPNSPLREALEDGPKPAIATKG